MFRRTSTRCTDRVVGPLAAVVLAGVITSCSPGGAEVADPPRAFVVATAPATTARVSSATSSSTSTSSTIAPTSTTEPATSSSTTPLTQAAAASIPPPTVAAPVGTLVAEGVAYCVGDSVMRAAGPALFDVLDVCQVVDAVESRQVRNAAGATAQAAASGAPVVVVHLGTNGPFTAAQLDTALAPLTGVPTVVLVTVQAAGAAHQAVVNAELRAAAGRHANVRIADFAAASSGQPGLFAADGIHLMRSGAELYARVIEEAAA